MSGQWVEGMPDGVSNLSIAFVHVLPNCKNADIACATQNEKENCRDAQVDGDGEEDAGKNDACDHYARSTPGEDGFFKCNETRGSGVLQLSRVRVSHASMLTLEDVTRNERKTAQQQSQGECNGKLLLLTSSL